MASPVSLAGESFDFIVEGTTSRQAVLAAALAKAGKKVLHVDPNPFYAQDEASLLRCESDQNKGALMDSTPRLCLARGAAVDVLIKSGASAYVDFHPLKSVCVLVNDQVIEVPSTKSALMKSADLTSKEKRRLLRAVTRCRNVFDKHLGALKTELTSLDAGASVPRPQNAFDGQIDDDFETFEEFLNESLDSEKTRALIRFGVAMLSKIDPKTSFEEGASKVGRAASALGRFGNTPYLTPTFGVSEISQAFCRIAAVHGAVYALETKCCAVEESLSHHGEMFKVDGRVVREIFKQENRLFVRAPRQSGVEDRRMVVVPNKNGAIYAYQCQGHTVLRSSNATFEELESAARRIKCDGVFERATVDTCEYEDLDSAIESAERAFHELCPGEEFFAVSAVAAEDDPFDF